MEQLIEIATALMDSLGVKQKQSRQAKALAKAINALKDQVFFAWCTEDILQQAEEHDCTLTNEDARWVLTMIKKHHDASIGINWEVIGLYIDLFVKEKARLKEQSFLTIKNF